MSRSRLSARARADLFRIWNDLAGLSEAIADRTLDQLDSDFQILAGRPGLGHRREELTDPAFRCWVVRRYVVVYRPIVGGVEILGVIHSSQDFEALALEFNASPED